MAAKLSWNTFALLFITVSCLSQLLSVPVVDASLASLTGLAPQTPQLHILPELRSSASNSSVVSPGVFQSQLSAMHSQAQRQLQQLGGLVANSSLAAQAANLTSQAGARYGNVLEVLSNVGKAIQQQINSAGQIQIITAPGAALGTAEVADQKKNEYRPIDGPAPAGTQQVAAASSGQGPLFAMMNGGAISAAGQSSYSAPGSNHTSGGHPNYREQGEQLRTEIVRRAGHLQQVVANSMEVFKNNGDLIVRRLLEQMNNRLDMAKSKADKIINEPTTNEMGLRALVTINQGLNNLNNIITNIVSRLDTAAKSGQTAMAPGGQQPAGNYSVANNLQRLSNGPSGSIFDPSRLKLNLQQLGQHFSSAIMASQQTMQQQQKQQVQLAQ